MKLPISFKARTQVPRCRKCGEEWPTSPESANIITKLREQYVPTAVVDALGLWLAGSLLFWVLNLFFGAEHRTFLQFLGAEFRNLAYLLQHLV